MKRLCFHALVSKLCFLLWYLCFEVGLQEGQEDINDTFEQTKTPKPHSLCPIQVQISKLIYVLGTVCSRKIWAQPKLTLPLTTLALASHLTHLNLKATRANYRPKFSIRTICLVSSHEKLGSQLTHLRHYFRGKPGNCKRLQTCKPKEDTKGN